MNLLHRYIFKQLVVATVMAVAIFVFVLVIGNIMREVLELLASGRLDWRMFFYLLALLIPGVVPYALPLGLLAAVLLVVGRLCAQNEYTAMRAAGLSLWTLAAPVLLVSCLGVLLCLFINFFYAPAADFAYRVSLANLARNNPLQFFQPGSYVRDFSGYVIYVGGREGEELEDVWGWKLDPQGRATAFIRARHGRLHYDAGANALVLTLKEGTAERQSAADPENMQDNSQPTGTFDEMPFTFPLNQLLGAPPTPNKLSLLTFPQLLAARESDPTRPNPTPAENANWRMLVQMQIQRHFAGAFSVLALALLGLPLALRVGRGENFVNLALALGLALTYYLLLFFLNLLHGYPALRPDLLLWLPNFIFEALGVYLLYRAAKR